MENLKISRIKAAGKNITNIGYLLLASIGLSLIMYFHLSHLLEQSKQVQVRDFMEQLEQSKQVFISYTIYGFVYLIILIGLLNNIFSAGKNLINCEINFDNDKGVVKLNYNVFYDKVAHKDDMMYGQ